MTKGWRVELIGPDGKTQVLMVAISDQAKAIGVAVAGRDVKSATAYPLTEEEVKSLSLADGQVLESRRIN